MIHETAIIDPKAKISSEVTIGPYCVIGPNVEIGKKSIIQSHVSIIGNTKIGENNNIYPFASICLLYTSPSPRDRTRSRMPSSA